MNQNSKSIIDLTNINEKVYEFIKERIIHLTYPPGHKIDVRELQRESGISQTPIKDALFRMAGEGMIEISARRGTFVKEGTEKNIEELFATRFILEAGAGDLIARGITDEQIEELDRLYNETLKRGVESNYELFMEKDRDFHTKIIEFTNNQRLIDTYSQLSSHMQIVRFRTARHNVGKRPWVDEDHLNILKALKERNPEKTVMHHVFSLWRKAFEADRNTRPARTYRIANEIPTLLMIAIVILVIVKPF